VQAVPKKQFLAAVRESARPYRPAWRVGASGLVRRFDSGYWAHIWFFDRKGPYPVPYYEAGLTAGVVSPYLLRTFNRQDTERAPRRDFIAVHACLTWDAPVVHFDPAATATREAIPPPFVVAREPDPRDEEPVLLTTESAPIWLKDALSVLVPHLTGLVSDEALLEWLAATDETRRAADLRYAALLAHHLRRDDEVTALLGRAAETRVVEDRAAEARGVDLSYRSDRQTTFPQDWSPERFERFLRAAPRD
jgi:hypothetical protein